MLDFNEPPLKAVIEILLRDMHTGGNILFHGKQLTKKLLPKIKPRALKDNAEKLLRTRTNAEVFTPSHVVKFMVNALDDGQIDSRWLEIACGEAPFITNRYDAESGIIIARNQRAGILDRKLNLTKTFCPRQCLAHRRRGRQRLFRVRFGGACRDYRVEFLSARRYPELRNVRAAY